MKGTRLRRASGDRGAAAVEFALVLIPLMLIVFGIIDFGRAYNAQETLTQAARVGARQASVHNSVASVQAAVAKAISTSDVTNIVVTDPDSCSATGNKSVTVTVTADFKYLGLPFGTIGMKGVATAPC